jgi:hypothetical protein
MRAEQDATQQTRREMCLDDWGSITDTEARPFSYPTGIGDSFPGGVKRPWLEANHLVPSSAEVKKTWSYTSSLQYIFMAWYFVKHKDSFTFIVTG